MYTKEQADEFIKYLAAYSRITATKVPWTEFTSEILRDDFEKKGNLAERLLNQSTGVIGELREKLTEKAENYSYKGKNLTKYLTVYLSRKIKAFIKLSERLGREQVPQG